MRQFLLLLIILSANLILASKSLALTYSYSGQKKTDFTQSYDLFLPKDSDKKTPLLVFVHGGYWVENDIKYGFGNAIAKTLNTQGIAVALVRYRLAPKYLHPIQMLDVSTAFSRLIQQKDNKQYNSDCIIAVGHSAGGHLISLLALDKTYLNHFKLDPRHLAAVVSISGIYDLTIKADKISEQIVNLYESLFGSRLSQLKAASPLHYIASDAPYFLILSGENDYAGFSADAKQFHQALKFVGHLNADILQLENRDHFQMVDFSLNNFELSQLVKSKINCLKTEVQGTIQ